MYSLQRLQSCFWLTFLCCLVSGLLLSSCKKRFDTYYKDNVKKEGYIYEKLKSNADFSLFVEAIDLAGLSSFIDEGGLYTVFAPTNGAFREYLTDHGYASISAIPQTELFQTLSFHIVNNMWYQYDFLQRFNIYRQSLFLTRSKKFVEIRVTDQSITVEGVPVIDALKDIDAGNGVIHGIGKVLTPLPNLETLLQTDPLFANSSFYKLMQVLADSSFDRFNSFDRDRDGVVDSVFFKTYPLLGNVYTSLEYRANTIETSQGGDPVFTSVIVPDNNSLNNYLRPILEKNGNDIKNLSPVFAYMLLQPYFLYDTTRRIPSSLLINRTERLTSVNNFIIPPLGEGNFIRKDALASNGIAHMIDSMFLLQDRLTSAFGQATTEGELSMFVFAVQQAGLTGDLSTVSNTRTAFAPTNQAFIDARFDVKNRTLNGATLTNTQFTNIIRNHIITAALAATALPGTTRATQYGSAYTLTFSETGSTVMSTDGTVANLTQVPVSIGPSGNTYIYKVDKLLLPRVF